jgi:hypothetical protein
VLRGTSRVSIRAIVCAAIATMAAFALAACGDSDDSAQSLSFELSGDGKAAKFSGPESAESGEAEITFTNETKEEAELQLLRVEGNHSAEEVVEGLEAASNGKPFPEWFFAGGGVSPAKPGESGSVTQVLYPGTYYTTNTEADQIDPKSMLAFEVTGDEPDEELEGDATVQAAEYSFAPEGLTAGENEIAFENVGAQPHHLLIAPLKGDGTVEDVEAAIKEEKGPPPFDESKFQGTAVIEGGESQLVEMDLEPGRYVMLCFISDRQGGPPHALKGMVDEVEVD